MNKEKIYSKFNSYLYPIDISKQSSNQASKQASKQYLSKKFSRFASLEIPAFKDCVTIKKDIRVANFNRIVPKHFSGIILKMSLGFLF
ncbi:MAG: hypothetical protein V1739_08735 [Candidatus Omnitrophota bacterium]